MLVHWSSIGGIREKWLKFVSMPPVSASRIIKRRLDRPQGGELIMYIPCGASVTMAPAHDHVICTSRSLLWFSTSCDTCHHARDEHRSLTETDRLILSEFAKAAGNQCQFQIPMHQVSRTGLFGTYDPIPVSDDAPDGTEEVGRH